MIIHVVAFRWKAGIPAWSRRDGEGSAAGVRVEHFPRCVRIAAGRMPGRPRSSNFDFAIVAEFDSADDWRVYDKHPRHEEIRGGVVRPWIETRASVQFEA